MNINILLIYSTFHFSIYFLYIFHISLFDEIAFKNNGLMQEQRQDNNNIDVSDLSTECGEENPNYI